MRIYFAGVDRPSFLEDLWRCGVDKILISYADFRSSFTLFAKHLDKYQFNIVLDSGAYSAYTRGIKLSATEYAEFITRWGNYFEGYFGLDVIGDFDRTWDNQDYLESQGLAPIPVFHYGEPLETLRIITRQYKRIGVGGMVPVSNSSLDKWLPSVFFDKDGRERFPGIQFHALGLTTKLLLEKYPWDSADSTKWLIGRKFGEVMTGSGNRRMAKVGEDSTAANIEWHLGLENDKANGYFANLRLF